MKHLIQATEKIFYPIIAAIGVSVNLMAVAILCRGKCGLSNWTTQYLVAMAMADLLVLTAEVILWRISMYYFLESFLYITPVCTFTSVLARTAGDFSVWFTVAFSFDRYIAICWQKMKTKYCTKKTAAVVLTTTSILFCLKNIPIGFTLEPAVILYNVPWGCSVKPSYYNELAWVAFDWTVTVLTPLFPFVLILLLNALTIRYILVTSQVRKRLMGQSKADNHTDPEMQNRRKSVILLFTISGSFIILWLPIIIDFLYIIITGVIPSEYNSSEFCLRQVGIMLRNTNCCTNTFIYVLTQSKFREQLQSVFKYLITSIMHLFKKRNN